MVDGAVGIDEHPNGHAVCVTGYLPMQSLKLLLGYPIVVADVVGDEALPSGKVGVFAGDADKVHTASQFFLFLMHFFECNSAWAAGGFPEV